MTPKAKARTPSRLRSDEIEREHLYHKDGVIVARHVVLKRRRAGKKIVLWERADGAGGWLTGLGDSKVGLYRYDEFRALPAAQRHRCPVLEGEKDVDASWVSGVPAVCGPNGASTWPAAFAQLLADAGVYEVPAVGDHDDAGASYSARVVKTCTALKLRAWTVPWEADRPAGFDVADFLAECGDEGPRRWRERLEPAGDQAASDVDPDDGFDFAGLVARSMTNQGAPFEPEALEALAALDRAAYEEQRGYLIRVKVRGRQLDLAVEAVRQTQAAAKAARDEEARQAEMRARPPAPSVDLDALLRDARTWLRRYVVLTAEQATAVVLWIAHTHAIDAAEATPYLQITSATKRAGKTRFLEVLEHLVARPWLTGRTTTAALVRRIDQEHSTLLLDESDAAFKGDAEYTEALRGVLNSGYRRSGKATVCVGHGADITVQDFTTFSPKAIAGIGNLPDTVADRSIPVTLRRRTDSEPCERWRERDGCQQAAPLRAGLARWASGAVPALQGARPDVPTNIGDRLADVWEPLLAIADLAGGEWPAMARRAAVELARVVEDQDRTVELLTDIVGILDALDPDAPFIGTKALLDGLVALDERPWATWRRDDKPMTAKGLALILKPLGIYTTSDGRQRGYRLDAFDDAIARYLPLHVSKRQNPNRDRHETPNSTRQDAAAVDTSKIAEAPTKTAVVDTLTLGSRGNGHSPHTQEPGELLFTRPSVPSGPLEPIRQVDAVGREFLDCDARENAEERAAIQAEGCEADSDDVMDGELDLEF